VTGQSGITFRKFVMSFTYYLRAIPMWYPIDAFKNMILERLLVTGAEK